MGATNKLLYGPAQVATGPATVYTVPALTTTSLEYIHVNNPSGSDVTFTLSIGADAAATRYLDAVTIKAKASGVVSWLEKYPRLALPTTTVIQLSAGTNNILVITLGGREFIAG